MDGVFQSLENILFLNQFSALWDAPHWSGCDIPRLASPLG